MNTHWTERLSDYLDGALSAADATACAAHLDTCADCRAVLSDLQAVIGIAKDEPEQMPATDLWPGIFAQIAPAEAGAYTQLAPAKAGARSDSVARARASARAYTLARARAYTFTLPQLALAASLLIAVSAGVAYLAAGRALSPSALREAPIQAQAEPLLPASAAMEPANFADAQYDEAVADLEKLLVDMRDELDPRTIIVIERNLAAIDQAIREARAAVEADPANTFLNSHLVDARRKKLELLRRATMIYSTSGD